MNVKILMVFTLLGLVSSATVFSQSYNDKLEVIGLLEGSWEGKLSYLNFQDGQTRGNVDLEIEGKKNGNEVELKYTYYNEGVVVREGNDIVVADNNDRTFDFNDLWRIQSFEKAEDGGFQIILTTKGRDNGKRAQMRKTINISESKLTIKRDIKYLKGEHTFFNRHIYSLEKK